MYSTHHITEINQQQWRAPMKKGQNYSKHAV